MSSRIGRFRRSCDRCHSQKLRCKREDGAAVCQRCTRAKAKCTFSTITRSKPSAAFVQSDYTVAAANVAVPPAVDQIDFDYPSTSQAGTDACATTREQEPNSLDFLLTLPTLGTTEIEWDGFLGLNSLQSTSPDDTLAASVETTNGYGVSPLTATDQRAATDYNSLHEHLSKSHDISTPHRNFDSSLRRRSGSSLDDLTHGRTGSALAIERIVPILSNLSVELHQFALTIPPVESCIDDRGKYTPLENREFALDSILKQSQRFIEILNQLHAPARAVTSGSSSARSESSNSRRSLSQASICTSTSSLALIDQPCELLVLSCYMRIVQTYHSFLEHVQECAKFHMRVPDHTRVAETLYRLPALSVGTFTMESTTSTHVSLLVHMIEAMMTRSRVLIQAIMRVCAMSPATSLGQWNHGPLPKQSAAQAALDGFRPQEERTMDLLMKVRRVLLDVAEVQWSSGI